MSLSALSIPQLQHVTQKLRISFLHRKDDFIRAIVNDFRYEQFQFREKLSCQTRPWTSLISHYFQDQYGDFFFFCSS